MIIDFIFQIITLKYGYTTPSMKWTHLAGISSAQQCVMCLCHFRVL